jgi:hypothetical protein
VEARSIAVDLVVVVLSRVSREVCN